MALIKCKECNNSVSNTAKTCPQCGAKIKSSSGCAISIVVFFGFLVFLFLFEHLSNVEKQTRAAAEQKRLAAMSPEEKALEEKKKADEEIARAKARQINDARIACKTFTERMLHDPDAAEFENYRTYYTKQLKNGEYHVQVRLRAKNAFNATRYTIVDCKTKLIGDTWVALKLKQLD